VELILAQLILNIFKENKMADIKQINIQTGEIVERDFLPEEIEQNNLAKQNKDIINLAKEQKDADAQSGNQKLLDLGLTQAEATALTGYTPPVAE
jgi:hypothetical protein